MPVQETAELLENAPKAVPTPVLAIVANRIVPAPDDATATAIDGATDGIALDAAKLFADLAHGQQPDVERLHSLGPPVAEVPLLGLERHDLRATNAVADVLRDQ
jgi:hypothetical protein